MNHTFISTVEIRIYHIFFLQGEEILSQASQATEQASDDEVPEEDQEESDVVSQ